MLKYMSKLKMFEEVLNQKSNVCDFQCSENKQDPGAYRQLSSVPWLPKDVHKTQIECELSCFHSVWHLKSGFEVLMV